MCLLILTILKSVLGTFKGLKSATPFVFFLLGACRNCASAIRQVNNLSGTQLTVKQHDFATQCNINHFDGIENGRG